ncbi:PHD finger protein ALFIN-like 2 [Vitis vinifera]|uniref:PHD finger protein ALFIN-LIKE n=1 Tax=Vitis vinifera TaxID=29760 RepID=A0A438DAK0_VITVI|nr:PHD finger protein ALFIN-like 2 [Vitis vinifera]
MEMASISSSPRTVEEIFKDYSGRRAGVVRALTYDVDEFYKLCDPGEVDFVFFYLQLLNGESVVLCLVAENSEEKK